MSCTDDERQQKQQLPGVVLYDIVCRHFRILPQPNIISYLSKLYSPPSSSSSSPTSTSTTRATEQQQQHLLQQQQTEPFILSCHNVKSDDHAVAICCSLLITYGMSITNITQYLNSYAPQYGQIHISLPLSPSPSPTTSSTTSTTTKTKTKMMIIDFSNNLALSNQGANAILCACILLKGDFEIEIFFNLCSNITHLNLNLSLEHSMNNIVGLNLDACPITYIPRTTLYALENLRWLSMRNTNVTNLYRLSDIINNLPNLTSVLIAGQSSQSYNLQHARRIASSNSNNIYDHQYPQQKFIVPLPYTPVTLSCPVFRQFVITQSSTSTSSSLLPSPSRLKWLDGVSIAFHERVYAHQTVEKQFQRAIPSSSLIINEQTQTITSNKLPNNCRILSLLRNRETGMTHHHHHSRQIVNNHNSKAITNRPKKRKRNAPTLNMNNTNHVQNSNNNESQNRSQSQSQSHSHSQIVNNNSKKTSISETNNHTFIEYKPRRADFDAIVASAGRMRSGILHSGHEMTVALAAVAANNNTSQNRIDIESVMFPHSYTGYNQDRNWLNHYNPQLQVQQEKEKYQQHENYSHTFEGCMDMALVNRKGSSRVSYWKQGNERPRQLEYNPGKVSEIVYATAGGRLVVVDEESGEVQASCNVGGIYDNSNNNNNNNNHNHNNNNANNNNNNFLNSNNVNRCKGERIDKTYDLNEAIGHDNSNQNNRNTSSNNNDNNNIEEYTAIYGISWLNKRKDVFLCGDYFGNIHFYNVEWMKSKRNRGVIQKCDPFQNLTSISVNCTDSKYAVSGSILDIGIFDIGSGKRYETMHGCHEGVINVIKYAHHDPNILLSSSFDGTCRKWDLRERRANGSRRPIFTTKSNGDNMMACFSPDDKWLLVSAVDNEVKQYHANDGRLALNFNIPQSGNRYNFTRSYYMNHGQYVVTGSCMQSSIRVYNSQDHGKLLTEIDVDDCYAHHHVQPYRRSRAMCIQSLRANPWRDFQLCALMFTPDQSVNELMAQVDLRTRCAMGLQSLFIVNKAGSLIFYRRLSEAAPQLSQNDYLHLASTFHGMQLLVQQLSPERPTVFGYGIAKLVTSTYMLQAFRAASGVQFFMTADLNSDHLDKLLKDIYVIYSDYVMKNPFYQLDMPIKVDKWDIYLSKLVELYHSKYSNSHAHGNAHTNPTTFSGGVDHPIATNVTHHANTTAGTGSGTGTGTAANPSNVGLLS